MRGSWPSGVDLPWGRKARSRQAGRKPRFSRFILGAYARMRGTGSADCLHGARPHGGWLSLQVSERSMNRSQLVFVILINALFTLLISSTALLIYVSRRPDPGLLIAPLPTAPPAASGTGRQATPPASVTAVPAPADAAATDAQAPARTYTVREGDSLGAIAQLFGVSQSALAIANGIANPNLIIPGQLLNIPSPPTAGGAADYRPIAADLALEVLNAGQYAAEALVIVNRQGQALNLTQWTVSTEQDGAYQFGQMPLLLRGESVRLFSRAGTDATYDKYWGRPPVPWTAGTTISLHDSTGAALLTYTVP